MCDTRLPDRPPFGAKPRWRALYALVATAMIAADFTTGLAPGGARRTALACVFVVATVAAVRVWLGRNRVELDLERWCECAGRQTRVRAIASTAACRGLRRPAVPAPSYPIETEHDAAVTLTGR